MTRSKALPDYISSGEVSRLLGVSLSYVRVLREQGKLPAAAYAGTTALYDPVVVRALAAERTRERRAALRKKGGVA